MLFRSELLFADVPRLREALATAQAQNGDLVLIGRRQLRSNNSWMHNLPKLVSGPERCTVLADEVMPFEDVTAEQLAERERAAERELVDAATDAEKAAAQKDLAVAKDLRRAQAYYASR